MYEKSELLNAFSHALRSSRTPLPLPKTEKNLTRPFQPRYRECPQIMRGVRQFWHFCRFLSQFLPLDLQDHRILCDTQRSPKIKMPWVYECPNMTVSEGAKKRPGGHYSPIMRRLWKENTIPGDLEEGVGGQVIHHWLFGCSICRLHMH